MEGVSYTAEQWAREFDRGLVRMVHRHGGTYEQHMQEHVDMFFSENFYGRSGKMVILNFEFQGRQCLFKAFVYDDLRVMDNTSNETLSLYGPVKRFKDMLQNRTFDSLNMWAGACYNALGGDIDNFPLTGRLFDDIGYKYEDLINVAKQNREANNEEVSDLSESEDPDSEDISPNDSDTYSIHSSRGGE